MTKVVEQIAETVVYDDEYDVEEGNGKTSTNNNNHNASEEEEEVENASEEEKEQQQQQQQQLIIDIETKYERYRDDQMNTGIIAALVGGFALTNSWEMNIYENENNLDVSNIELSSYTLAILAVHGCTCSALVSAFLYRSITRVKSPQAGVQWVERHPILVQLPWYKVHLHLRLRLNLLHTVYLVRSFSLTIIFVLLT